ncbi:hypothetical protein GMOD_00006069 [Pyrenophora seminiperda CCB06]|uniref:Uncharacterized protein n=1 Tax=Pyrenophora seminiperda CCB06 TaxID=1302712 RepID=A0A3M7M475_9PLEO|nr:hypothetical protein GMOD_00006069 [Pyrenophora seminiperda CCB06]
MRLRSHEGIS